MARRGGGLVSRGQGPARSLLTAPFPARRCHSPRQVQGWHGARRGAVRGSPARAPVVSPHCYRYVIKSLGSSTRLQNTTRSDRFSVRR